MIRGSPDWNVEYLTALMSAYAEFETQIKKQIRSGIQIKDRCTSPHKLVGPDAGGYAYCFERFSAEVSSQKSAIILSFLYQFEKYLKTDQRLFVANYQNFFEKTSLLREKFCSIIYNYPKIDQTPLSIILASISDTIIGYRLEDLERIGLVERSPLKPPNPKYVCISDKGVTVIESAIRDGAARLMPILGTIEESRPETSLGPNGEEKRRLQQ
jgi:hypothetical protein